MLIALWLFLVLLCSGHVGNFFGVHYLLLTPEYLGRVDFWSFMIVGLAAGWFYMTWNLTSYLLVSNRFPFLATLKAPFTKFCINNSFIPLVFLLIYLILSIQFQRYQELSPAKQILINVSGFIAGFSLLVFLLSGYFFFTNKDIYSVLHIGKIVPKEGSRLFAPGMRVPTLQDIKSGSTQYRCDFYLNEYAKWRPVRNVAHYNRQILEQVFKQNHTNAVVVQVTSMLVLMGLGLFMEQAWARIPTGATIFILGSLVVAAFGALIFWFRHWATMIFIIMIACLNYLTGLEIFNYRSRAIGLAYDKCKPPQAYTYKAMQDMCTDSLVATDWRATRQILDNWARKNTKNGEKPKMVLLCFSGGGLRSAQWSFQNLVQINALTNGKLLERTALMTGASGGMYGATWFRNLALTLPRDSFLRLDQNEQVITQCSKDLLNPITFAIVSNDLFFPLTKVKVGSNYYHRDRGYMLEKGLLENSQGLLAGTVSDYQTPEQQAKVPLMIYAPFILNDGRKLLIGAQRMSYLMMPLQTDGTKGKSEIDAVDFGRMFAHCDADSLRITSALRMNSTFPLILPNVWLPTKPSMEIMDGGIRDNYGVNTAVRFAHAYSDWIKANTSGVIIVQMRSWNKIAPIEAHDNKGIVEEAVSKATVAGLMTQMEDFRIDNDLSLLSSILGPNMLEIVRFEYTPLKKESEASLSFHLSKREQLDIINAYFRPENLQEARRLKALLE